VQTRTHDARDATLKAAPLAARKIIRAMSSPNEWVSFGASKVVLEHALKFLGEQKHEWEDTAWIAWAKPEELDVVLAIANRCVKRMEDGEGSYDPSPPPKPSLPEPTLDDLIQPDELVIPPEEPDGAS
jgi:hypothetical protein